MEVEKDISDQANANCQSWIPLTNNSLVITCPVIKNQGTNFSYINCEHSSEYSGEAERSSEHGPLPFPAVLWITSISEK